VTHWVVVGAGSAGIVAATRLSEDAETQVTLLESGHARPDDPTLPPDADLHGGDFFSTHRPERVHELLVVPVAGAAPRPYLRGRGIGGSGAINAMLAPPGGPYADVPHLLHTEPAAAHEWGPVDRALVAAAPDAGPVPLTRRDGHRTTVAATYLAPAMDRPNLAVRTGAVVDRVVLVGRRAAGVRLVDGGELPADRVVLAAGALHSPAILLRSHVDTPGVGEGLQDHPSAAITLELAPDAVTPPGALAAAALLARDGLHVLPLNHVGARRYGALMAAVMRPRSQGRVTLSGVDPSEHPHVEMNLLDDPADVAAMVRGVELLLDLLRHPAFGEIVVEAYVDDAGTPAAALTDRDAIARWVRGNVGDYAHASSTCAMGRVVDGRGAVSGYDGLFVCDASVFEHVPEVNPHLATVRLAEHLAARWRLPTRGD
jgi:choline dehydrogenase-like flavoprotein